MKIAIIGAGFSGCSIALRLSKNNKVDLFEKNNDILSGASAYNQMRFHYGYHYPRSQKTINEIKKSKKNFIKLYGNDIFGKTENFYCIPKLYSKTSPKNYEKFLKKNKLFFKKLEPDKNLSNKIETSYLVKEKILDYFYFKKKVFKMLKNKNIRLKTKNEFSKKLINNYDKIIISSYSNNNLILKNLDLPLKNKFKYELIEKIVIQLPKIYKKKSFVIIDGNFVCCDPYLGTNFHLLSDVKHSKIQVLNQKIPLFSASQKNLVNKKPKKNVNMSNFNKFIKRSSKYLPFLKKAKYIKSMFTIRTLKINKENTDERTSYLKKINDKIYVVLTGKWNTSVTIADQIYSELKKR